MIAALLLASLTASTPDPVDVVVLDSRIEEIFRPYREGSAYEIPWERPLFSAEVNALIAHWQRVLPHDEPDRLNDGDWLCLCQDWNREGFRVVSGRPEVLQDGRVHVGVGIDLGFSDVRDVRDATLVFISEEGMWKIDDIRSDPDFPDGLKQALHETIAEDEALAASRRDR